MQKNIKNLTKYYNEKAKKLDELLLTYNNPNKYKKNFYKKRFTTICKILEPKKNEVILDLGCGSGYYTKYLKKCGCNVTATDISQNYLNQAKKYVGSGVKFVVSDTKRLPFKENTFDKILVTEVIEHIPHYDESLKEIARVLKKGGVAVVTTPNKHSYMNIAYNAKRIINKYDFNEHVVEFSEVEFAALLKKHFTSVEISYTNYLVPYPFDIIAIKIDSDIVNSMIDKIEKKMSLSRLLKKKGWTMIAKVKK